MLCQKCDLPHGLLNKREGLRHLQAIKQQGRLGKIEVEEFSVVESREALREMIMDKGRAHTLFVRASTLAGDEIKKNWGAQPREKFALLENGNARKIEKKISLFFDKLDRYPEYLDERKSAKSVRPQKASPLVYLAMKLPDDYYRCFIEVFLNHDLKSYGASLAFSFNGRRYHTSEEPNTAGRLVLLARVKFSVNGECPTQVVEADAPEIMKVKGPAVRYVKEAMPELMSEFSRGDTRLRMAVYEKNYNPVAFDWLKEDKLI